LALPPPSAHLTSLLVIPARAGIQGHVSGCLPFAPGFRLMTQED
jgi:hypothetical protein